jgi:endo-1,4-beta-xylanase
VPFTGVFAARADIKVVQGARVRIGIRRVGKAVIVILACALATESSGQSLRQAADKVGILVGTAVRAPQLSETTYAVTLGREYNMVEAEDAMKWWVVRPDRNTYDFRQGDEIVRFAESHSMKVRGHCLLWGRNNPAWLAEGTFTHEQLSQLLHEHIERVMKHYAGQVFAWDVVNEVLDENGNLRDSIWYNQPGIGIAGQGTAYIEQAFRWAREADPHALLFYNEAEGEGMNRKSDAIFEMVKGFKRRNIPIDGVGLQMHIPTVDVDLQKLGADLSVNIARLAALGMQVHITELDVSLPTEASGRARTEDRMRQAEIYRTIVRACLDNAGCTAIQTWGFTDKYSWIGSHSRGARGEALPFDRAYAAKSAYQALLDELTKGQRVPH